MDKLLRAVFNKNLWSVTQTKSGNTIIRLLKDVPLASEVVKPGQKGLSILFTDDMEQVGKVITTVFHDGVAGRTFRMPKADLLKERGAFFSVG